MEKPQASHDQIESCKDRNWACYDRCDVREFGLIQQSDIRGLLHCHTAYGDGDHDLIQVAETALKLGLEYVGVTDHMVCTQCPAGIEPLSLELQRREIALINRQTEGFTLLHGIELESEPDGSLPMDDQNLDRFDYVVATLRDKTDMDRSALTDIAVRAVMNPFVSILGHPFDTYMTGADDTACDMEVVLKAAATAGVAVSVDANPTHETLDLKYCRLSQNLGATLVISSDAHRAARLGDYRHGTVLTQLAGICCRQILNTMDVSGVRAFFKESHQRS